MYHFNKKFFLIFLPALLGICLSCSTLQAAPETPPGAFVSVCSAMVYDLDNDAILFEQNADQQIPPASLTKIMSMLLARDFIKNGHAKMSSPVTVSTAAANAGGSSMGIRPGEQVSLEKLLMGMAVSSGNDASYAVAEYVGGSAEAFVRMMNARAAELGMHDTHFANPHGLPDDRQYTTARDMLTLARAYLRAYPDALSMHNTKVLRHGNYTSWNKNPLLGQYPGADGLKSGWIRASGYNLLFTATRGDRRLLAVIMGAPDSGTRGAEACRLLDAGFMVCGNTAVSVAAALDSIPYDDKRIDARKTAREAGLLKLRPANSKAIKVMAKNKKHIKTASKNKKYGKLALRKNVKKPNNINKRKAHAASPTAKQRHKRG